MGQAYVLLNVTLIQAQSSKMTPVMITSQYCHLLCMALLLSLMLIMVDS